MVRIYTNPEIAQVGVVLAQCLCQIQDITVDNSITSKVKVGQGAIELQRMRHGVCAAT